MFRRVCVTVYKKIIQTFHFRITNRSKPFFAYLFLWSDLKPVVFEKIKTCCFRVSLPLFSCLLLMLLKNKSHIALKQVGTLHNTITQHNLECKGRFGFWCGSVLCTVLLLLVFYLNLFTFGNSTHISLLYIKFLC